jgi:hypothetical protein
MAFLFLIVARDRKPRERILPSCTHANRISIGKFNSPELTVIAGNSRVVVKAR